MNEDRKPAIPLAGILELPQLCFSAQVLSQP
jgi:hypothetical protein